MPKTEIIYARLELESYDRSFRLVDRQSEISIRLVEVLSEKFHMEPLTQTLAKLHPEVLGAWSAYIANPTMDGRPKKIQAVAKFEVSDTKVELLDIAFN